MNDHPLSFLLSHNPLVFLPSLGYKVLLSLENSMQKPPSPWSRDTRSPSPGVSRGESSLKRKALSLALFIILASSILNALFGDRGFIEMLKARQQLQALEHEIRDTKVENQRLLEEIRALKTSPLAIERLAREKLGLVKPGEVILLIEKTEDRDRPRQ
jgi:cell division protein FtsB